MPVEHKENSTTSQKNTQRQRNGKDSKVEPKSLASGIMNLFKAQQSTQNNQKESFSSTSSFHSVCDGTIIYALLELPLMISVVESKRKALEERKNNILKIKDDQIKKKSYLR